MNKVRKFYVIVVLVMCGFIVGCNGNKSEKSKESIALMVTPKKTDYISQLRELKNRRLTTKTLLRANNLALRDMQKDLLAKESKIQLAFDKKVNEALPEIHKAKYSNVKKRKQALEQEKKDDKELQKLLKLKEAKEEERRKLNYQQEVERVEERYLFKEIDLKIAFKELELAEAALK